MRAVPELSFSPHAISPTHARQSCSTSTLPHARHPNTQPIPPPTHTLPRQRGLCTLGTDCAICPSNCPLKYSPCHVLSNLPPPNMSLPLQLPPRLPVLDTGCPLPHISPTAATPVNLPSPSCPRANPALVRPAIPLAYHTGSQPNQASPPPLWRISASQASSAPSLLYLTPTLYITSFHVTVARDLPYQDGLKGISNRLR